MSVTVPPPATASDPALGPALDPALDQALDPRAVLRAGGEDL